MKKILILCFLGDPTYPSGSISGTGGFNASVKDILSYLIDSNSFECIFITNTMWDYAKALSEKISNKIILYRICSGKKQSMENGNYTYDVSKFRVSVEEIIKDFTDISFIHSFYWLSGMVASELSDKYQIPFIHTTVSLSKEKIRFGFRTAVVRQLEFENIFLKKATYILSITEEEKKLLVNDYHISEEKIIVEGQTVAEAFHFPLYDSYGIPSSITNNALSVPSDDIREITDLDALWWNCKAFIYVGRITFVKGLDIIIQAWITLEERYNGHIPPLWIVGNTPYEIECFREQLKIEQKTIEKFETENRIVWWGYLSPSAISILYLKTAVLVTHSAFESGGRMILEALCQGIPVITTNTGFGKDYITNWYNGFVVDYGDIRNLIHRMSHFIQNPFLSNVLGSNAKTTFKNLETIWHHKTRIVKLYESLIQRKEYIDDIKVCCFESEDAFKKGIIETFPYYYLQKTELDIARILYDCENKENQLILTQSINKIENNDIWEYKKEYIVKYMYSKINKRKIWDISQKNSVFSERYMLKIFDCIFHSPSILKPLKIDRDNSFIIMPYINILSKIDILQNRIKIAECLNKFSDFEYNLGTGVSLAEYWRNIKENIRLLDICSVSEFYSKIPYEIKQFMEQISEPLMEHIHIQYEQSVIGHIGLYQGSLTLLPTYHCIIAEKGYDAGKLLLDILHLENNATSKNTLTLLNAFSDIFDISEHKILEWAFCIFIDDFIQKTVFGKMDDSCYNIYQTLQNLFVALT